MAHLSGFDAGETIDQAHAQTGPYEPKRAKAQRESLIRNRVILERLGCIDEAGMIKLRKGNAPTITKGPYAGKIVTGDHIIPRSVCPELDNALFNLEFMPLTLNQKKAAKVTQRQIDLARRWHKLGILSEEGLEGAGPHRYSRNRPKNVGIQRYIDFFTRKVLLSRSTARQVGSLEGVTLYPVLPLASLQLWLGRGREKRKSLSDFPSLEIAGTKRHSCGIGR